MMELEFEDLRVPEQLIPRPRHPLSELRTDITTLDPLVLVPYAHRLPEVVAALKEAYLDVVWAPCTNDDDYYWYVHELWQLGKTFIINEHDIVPKPGDAEELLACDEPWCGRPYSIGTCYQACLGFTKFHSSLMTEFPEALDWVGAVSMADDGAAQRTWHRLDTRIFQFLNNHGYNLHTHWPPIRHENKAQHVAVEITRGWSHWPARALPD